MYAEKNKGSEAGDEERGDVMLGFARPVTSANASALLPDAQISRVGGSPVSLFYYHTNVTKLFN